MIVERQYNCCIGALTFWSEDEKASGNTGRRTDGRSFDFLGTDSSGRKTGPGCGTGHVRFRSLRFAGGIEGFGRIYVAHAEPDRDDPQRRRNHRESATPQRPAG